MGTGVGEEAEGVGSGLVGSGVGTEGEVGPGVQEEGVGRAVLGPGVGTEEVVAVGLGAEELVGRGVGAEVLVGPGVGAGEFVGPGVGVTGGDGGVVRAFAADTPPIARAATAPTVMAAARLEIRIQLSPREWIGCLDRRPWRRKVGGSAVIHATVRPP
ncbi:hypothetical protein [Micromonospora sp. KC213]|uniref:hypothetical protein n=1 Tax=Micromonospora sp. KC213 TaxID=2530378 RepID=UPI001404E127|nr:hypothetical protein [Micromonospora sp. KC213]